MNVKRENRELDPSASEATMDELREFLEGDVLGADADPNFKEALRRKLWDLVQAKIGRDGSDIGSR